MEASKAWGRYWASGQAHSCFADGKPYDSAPIWTPAFDAAPPGARVLDLAAGGGALTRLAAEHPLGFEVTGVDYAGQLPAIPGARMMAGVSLEALPFDDGAFDLVISQFGLEYADKEIAAHEAARVVATGGRAAFLMHHADGEVAASSTRMADRVEPLLADGAAVDAVIALGQAMEDRLDVADRRKRAAEKIAAIANASSDPTVAWAIAFLQEMMAKQPLFPPAYLIENGQTLHDELSAYVLRARAMAAAACSGGDIDSVHGVFLSHGFAAVERSIISDQAGAPLAWWIQSSR